MIKAELIDHMGSDLTVVNAARVSMDKESSWHLTDCQMVEFEGDEAVPYGPIFNILKDTDSRLINYLSKHQHFTPFTHCQITLRETVPIFVARQRFKHVVGFTYNEVSRRYVSSEPEFFIPETLRQAADNVKQGSSVEPVEDDAVLRFWLKRRYREYLRDYQYLLSKGVCPEQARMVLPQSMLTSYYVTGSLMAFARAYKQRIDPHAQKEIQDLAVQWDTIIGQLFPDSWLALTRPHT